MDDNPMTTLKDIVHYLLSKTDWMKTFTGVSNVLIFSYMVYMLLNVPLSETNKLIIIHILGIMEGAYISQNNYYFGSSKGSQDKSETIKRQIDDKTHKPESAA